MKRALLSSFILILISSCGYVIVRATPEVDPQGAPVPVTQLGPKRSGPRWSYGNSSMLDALRVVIRDREAWLDFWKRSYRPNPELPPSPEIDFSREMIVVAALGQRPNSGYGIIIESAYERDNQLEINVRSISLKGCGVWTVITSPIDIVRIPKTERPVVFREIEAVRDCSGRQPKI